jgi:CheY-like chemotaxis protein
VCLEHDGYRVIGAVDALSALASARAERPDVIVMDGGLPGMTGWEAVSVLKADPELRTIPTLMLTGHVLDGARQRALDAGADGFIGKPCLPNELAREIRAALALHSKHVLIPPSGQHGHAVRRKPLRAELRSVKPRAQRRKA